MNSQQLFEAIGHIDDEFVLEALEEKKAKNTTLIKSIISIAAVVVVMFSFGLFQQSGEPIIFNEINFVSTKEIPVDLSEYEIMTLSFQEVAYYLDEINLPSRDELMFADTKLAYDDDQIVYDTFILNYQGFEITTTKVAQNKKSLFTIGHDVKASDINGSKVYLARSKEAFGDHSILYAELMVGDIFITVQTREISESDFIEIIQTLLSK